VRTYQTCGRVYGHGRTQDGYSSGFVAGGPYEQKSCRRFSGDRFHCSVAIGRLSAILAVLHFASGKFRDRPKMSVKNNLRTRAAIAKYEGQSKGSCERHFLFQAAVWGIPISRLSPLFSVPC
jgi:hypothetical protein